jgi:hypothetical protein
MEKRNQIWKQSKLRRATHNIPHEETNKHTRAHLFGIDGAHRRLQRAQQPLVARKHNQLGGGGGLGGRTGRATQLAAKNLRVWRTMIEMDESR